MKRSVLFYIWVAIVSYLTGPLVYSVTLWVLEGEKVKDIDKLLTWTAPTFFSVGILLFLLCIILLRSINKYNFWSQTLAFALVGIIPITIVPFLTGFSSVSNFNFVVSPEGALFILFFTSIAIICSYGTWVAQKKLNKIPFIIISLVIFILFIIIV
ncbi:hypothetical protein [Paenibacillus dakarensis]|uniref:hypothetical protein n=1 Tax=Paenibacillus dakarensis TaxID=1527293 RepID=UPI0006D58859|nr:hypothetical protein [Paenibacillus dakarensis]